MATDHYQRNMVTAQRVVSPTFQNWSQEHAGMPHGSVGDYRCYNPKCGRTNHLVVIHGEYLFQHLKCGCGHVMCHQCCSNTVKFETTRKLRCDPVKVPLVKCEPPYFTICPSCGLAYFAQAKATDGVISDAKMALTSKKAGKPCDCCGFTVNSHWPRVTLVGSRFGVSGAPATQTPSRIRTASLLVQSVTGSFKQAMKRRFAPSTSSGKHERSLDLASTPGASRQRRRMDRDHNLPYGWEVVGYDGERYIYRDVDGKMYRTQPGNRYGPYEDLS